MVLVNARPSVPRRFGPGPQRRGALLHFGCAGGRVVACVFAMTRLSRVLGFATRSTHPSSQVATSATSCLRTARDQSGSSRKCGGDRYFKPVPENYKYHPSAATIRVSPKSRGTPSCSPVTLVDSGGARARSEKRRLSPALGELGCPLICHLHYLFHIL